jgi:hypothetical protein
MKGRVQLNWQPAACDPLLRQLKNHLQPKHASQPVAKFKGGLKIQSAYGFLHSASTSTHYTVLKKNILNNNNEKINFFFFFFYF